MHTHSTWATSWAQAGRNIPCYGTTHADYIYQDVPCVRNLTKQEIDEAYELNTGILIADAFAEAHIDYVATPAVLCKNHGPFTWGKDAHEAVHNAVVLEEVAKDEVVLQNADRGLSQSNTKENEDKININTADETQLMKLSGIGESRAKGIVSYRLEHGNFSSIEEIKNVSGIGEAIFSRMKDKITV